MTTDKSRADALTAAIAACERLQGEYDQLGALEHAEAAGNCADAIRKLPQAVEQHEAAPCVHADDPKSCYRVRCQLGNKCVDDDMSPRQVAPSARAPRTEVAGAVSRSVIFSLECTANWLEGGCDPKAAAHEIRLNLEKLRAPSAYAAAAPADERAALLRDALFYLKGNLPDGPSDHKRKAQVIAGLEGLARAAASQPASDSHEWDDVGERCIKCGDKDWMADPVCRGATPVAASGQKAATMPYLYVYEYESHFGLHREFSPRKWNGMKPTRTVALYTAPPAQVATRQGLTDKERNAIECAISEVELCCQFSLANELRTLLEGAKQ